MQHVYAHIHVYTCHQLVAVRGKATYPVFVVVTSTQIVRATEVQKRNPAVR